MESKLVSLAEEADRVARINGAFAVKIAAAVIAAQKNEKLLLTLLDIGESFIPLAEDARMYADAMLEIAKMEGATIGD